MREERREGGERRREPWPLCGGGREGGREGGRGEKLFPWRAPSMREERREGGERRRKAWPLGEGGR